MFYFDPLYLILLAPAMILAVWAQWRTQSAFHEGMRYRASRGLSGAQAAAEVLQAAGVTGVRIEPVEGFLTDHYDPRERVLRLSPQVFHGQSLSAVGVAAHEAGHAVQHATGYPLLALRNGLVPLASVGGNLAWLIILAGFLLMAVQPWLGHTIVLLGIGAFSLVVLFQLVNLPVEFDASKRARLMLVNYGLISEQEDVVVRRVLGAAAMTYVAATLAAVLQLLYWLIRAGVLGGRDDR
jgi:hypothetical protein